MGCQVRNGSLWAVPVATDALSRQRLRKHSVGSDTWPLAVVFTGLSPRCTLDVGCLFHFACSRRKLLFSLLPSYRLHRFDPLSQRTVVLFLFKVVLGGDMLAGVLSPHSSSRVYCGAAIIRPGCVTLCRPSRRTVQVRLRGPRSQALPGPPFRRLATTTDEKCG